MKTLLQPKVLIPLILSVALIVALLAFTDVKKVVTLIEGFQKIYLLWFLLLMVAYEAVRGAQWYFLLRALDIRVPVRTQIFAFAGGEVTKSVPTTSLAWPFPSSSPSRSTSACSKSAGSAPSWRSGFRAARAPRWAPC